MTSPEVFAGFKEPPEKPAGGGALSELKLLPRVELPIAGVSIGASPTAANDWLIIVRVCVISAVPSAPPSA